MNKLTVNTNKKEEFTNALAIYKDKEPEGGELVRFAGALVAFVALTGLSLPWFLPLLGAVGVHKGVKKLQQVYTAYDNRFYLLKPKTVIRDGRLALDTYSAEDIPKSFPENFKKGKLYRKMDPIDFIDVYNNTILRYYSSGEENLFKELVDSLILAPLKDRLERDKIKLNPTIADIYYSLKYEYSERDDINNFSKGDYRSIINNLPDFLIDKTAQIVKETTGFDINAFKDQQRESKVNMPHPEVHKYISRLDPDSIAFFISGFDTYGTFDEIGVSQEFFSLGIKDFLKEAYNKRIVLKYLGRFTEENELEFNRFVAIVDEAKKDLSDYKVVTKIVEYFSIIENKFEDAEALLVEHKKNPGKFSTNDKDLINFKLETLIEQSKQ